MKRLQGGNGVTPERNGVTSDARLHVARKTKAPDDWDPPIPVYDPYGPGNAAIVYR